MPHLCRQLFFSFFAIFLTLPASAQGRSPVGDPPTPNEATQSPGLTGKERLGKKWMDEQRIDNCNVPIDKRGTKSRPSTCPSLRTG